MLVQLQFFASIHFWFISSNSRNEVKGMSFECVPKIVIIQQSLFTEVLSRFELVDKFLSVITLQLEYVTWSPNNDIECVTNRFFTNDVLTGIVSLFFGNMSDFSHLIIGQVFQNWNTAKECRSKNDNIKWCEGSPEVDGKQAGSRSNIGYSCDLF